MKKMYFIYICLIGMLISNSLFAQSVTISKASVISVPNNQIVFVSGTLTGVKGIPITGYTIDLLYGNNQSVRIATNVASSGGNYHYTGFVPTGTQISDPYKVKVTTNRQKSATVDASNCTCN